MTARLDFTMLTIVPDRPAGAQELCPVVTFEDDASVLAEHGLDIQTATGAMFTGSGGWAIINMQLRDAIVLVALDLGDPVVKRLLGDAPSEGLLVGLVAPTGARAIRVSVDDVLPVLRQRALRAVPASRSEQSELTQRLLDHIDGQDWPFERGPTKERLYVALPVDGPVTAPVGASPALAGAWLQ